MVGHRPTGMEWGAVWYSRVGWIIVGWVGHSRMEWGMVGWDGLWWDMVGHYRLGVLDDGGVV